MFGLVRQSIAEELGTSDSQGQPALERPSTNSRRQYGLHFATFSQIKALHAITRQQGIDLSELLRKRFGVKRPGELSLKQASELIDSLKADLATGSRPPAAEGRALEYLPQHEG